MNKLNLFGPVTTRTGYGVFVVNLARELSKHFDLTLTPRSLVQEPALVNDMVLRDAMEKGRHEYDYDAPSLNIWHSHNMQQFHSDWRIGFPIFEGSVFKPDDRLHINSLDRVAVTSKWAQEIVLDQTDFEYNEVFVFNGGIDPEIFCRGDELSIPAIDQFTGPKAINVGKWEVRKGQADIIKALGDVRPELTLFGMWDNPFWPGWRDFCVQTLQDNGWVPIDKTRAVWQIGSCTRLVLVGWIPDHIQYAQVLRKMDFGIFPFRSEGWCLPLHECLACGVSVIASNYSAPTEYLNEDAGVLLNDGTMQPVYDQIHFPDGGYGNWYVPDHVELCDAIATIMKADWDGRGYQAAFYAGQFTWEAAVKKAKDQLIS